MRVVAVSEGMPKWDIEQAPWNCHRAHLKTVGIELFQIPATDMDWSQQFDCMLLHIWLDWDNPKRYTPQTIMPVFAKYAEYRAKYPDTIQIICNHTDMVGRPYALPYWRKGDPVLYKIPPYDRRALSPFPEMDIWPWELAYDFTYGRQAFTKMNEDLLAAFVGTPSGPEGYRASVAEFTNRVGVGICLTEKMPQRKYDELMSRAKIIVCPRGWGESSSRHWDAWRSGKAVLTDADCDAVEMIPGQRLRSGIHYLTYKNPSEIPDIVSDWTKASRINELHSIAKAGQQAANSFNGADWISKFFLMLRDRHSRS
jgi:hypothetical protein